MKKRDTMLSSGLLFVLQLVLGACFAPLARSEVVRYLEVSENAPAGTRIGFIDADSPPYLVVPVPGSAVKADLIVEESTGEIRTRVPLDRETRSSYSLVAVAHNVRVVVKVLDENDNSPKFPVESVDLEFPENSPRDAKRALPPAKDPDLGRYSTQRYEIVSGNDDDMFRISQHRGRDGVLYLDLQNSGSLDRESRDSYYLVIEASDGGTPPLSSRLKVNVTVQDVNDNPPIFNQTRYEASVPENATIGTAILKVNATDADIGDNGLIEYSINRRQSDRDEIFRIDASNGMIYVNKALDFEARERHDLVIVARDRGAQTLEASAFLSVRVTDVNDNQPAITVIFLSDDATPKISESAQPGEFVARISVSDPDSRTEYSNATVTLTGGDGHFGLATRDNIRYLVVVERPLDREEKSIYDLSIEATDAGTPPLRALRTFRLLVTDVNDNAPIFENDRYEAHLLEASEPGTSVLRVRANDLDEGPNSDIKYSIFNTTWFSIDRHSGVISTVTHVDCETDPSPTLIVVAEDSGRPSLSSTATVRLTVHDLNDNEPIFEKPLYNATVPENLGVGRCFIKVKIIKTCHETETNAIGISGNEPDSLIASLMDGNRPIPVVLLNGGTRTVDSEPVSRISRHKLQHFVIMVSSSMELKDSLVTIKKSRWWNHMANFHILNLPMSDDGCSRAYEILSTAWEMDILEAKFMCIDETKRRIIYSFNPYTSDAPNPWKVEKIYRSENDHPWTLFVREYHNNYNVCDNMNFDKTKDLGGYGIRLSFVRKESIHEVVNKTGVDAIGGFHGPLFREIFRILNANVTKLLEHGNLKFVGTVDGYGNANGFLGEIVNGVTDIALLRLSIQTLANVTYTYPHMEGGVSVMTQYRGYKSQLSKLASVIDVSSRIGVCLVILVTVIFMKYFLCQNLSTAILNTMRLICNSCLVKVPTTVGSRIYLSSLFVLIVTILGIYQGQWAAMLSKHIRLPDIDTMSDLAKSDLKIYGNHYMEQFFSDRVSEGQYVGVDSWNCTEYVLSYPNLAACVNPLIYLIYEAARFKLHLSKHPVINNYDGFVIRENWPLEKRINELIQRLVESDQFEYSQRKHYAETFRAIETNRHEDKDGRVRVLTLSDLSFAFAILAVGLGCATICFIFEVLIYSGGARSRNMLIPVVRPSRY